jgi:amino acid transporter
MDDERGGGKAPRNSEGSPAERAAPTNQVEHDGNPASESEAAPEHTGRHRHIRVMAEQSSRDNSRPARTEAPVSEPPVERPAPKPHKVSADLRREEVVKGSHPGDKYIRYERNVGGFRRKRSGVLAASLEVEKPRSGVGKLFNAIKRVLIGRPISTEHSMHERLTNLKALAILSSDALSSVAYATEEILKILLLGGVALLAYALPIGIAIIVLLIIVVSSYRQTIAAYPRGGGTYIVAKDNLGTLPGLIAASSILIGYILTVAVSVAAGVAALYSLYPSLFAYRVQICLALIVFITIANLRGMREAGNIFSVPTYAFIVGVLGLIFYGVLRVFFGVGGAPVYEQPPPSEWAIEGAYDGVLILLLLRAFTQGSAALTGVEAIADGVPAFKPPEAANARKTLLWMGAISAVMFFGITLLAMQLRIMPIHEETVVSQIARTVFPPILGANPLHFFIQIATALILVLAANTAFADFPRLGYFMARDKFMPHQYAFRGDRLAFSWGIVTLAALACALVVAYGGDTSSLIPLYAVGVFGAFTMSQAGMVARWWRLRPPGWWRNFAMNLTGSIVTFTVLSVATLTKLDKGTWIVIVLIPVLILLFLGINRHYRRFESEVEAVTPLLTEEINNTVIVPVANLNAVAISALAYARSISPNVTAVHIAEGEDEEEAARFHEQWHKIVPNAGDLSLVIIESPYRSLIGPLLSYIDALDQQSPDDTITIVLPELLPAKPWEYILHGQSALRLKAALLFRPNTVVVNIPYVIGKVARAAGMERGSLAAAGSSIDTGTFMGLMRQFPLVPVMVLIFILIIIYLIFLD